MTGAVTIHPSDQELAGLRLIEMGVNMIVVSNLLAITCDATNAIKGCPMFSSESQCRTVAQMFGLTAGRVSQLRAELKQSWGQLQGELADA